MIIDFHVHLFGAGHLPKRWFTSLAAHLAARKPGTVDLNAFAQRLEARILDPDAAYLIKDMDDAKVDLVISHPLDYGLALGEPDLSMEKIVEHNAALQARHPNRYFSFTSIDPRRPGAPEFIRATSRKYGLKGLNLYPPAGFDPASPECMKVCRIALEEDLPVLFHTGGANFPMKPRYGSPHLLGDVQAELPDLKIILGHAGFPYQWEEAITVARRNPNAYLEISQWYKLASRDHSKFVETLAEVKSEVGADRVLFGSDHLTGPGLANSKADLVSWIDCIRRLPEENARFTTADVDLILGRNAQRLLKLEGVPLA